MATFPSRPVSRKRNSSTDEVAKAKLAHQNPERTVHARRYLEIHQNLKLSGENYEDDSQDNHRVGSRIFRTCFHRDANTENDYDSIQNSDRGSASVDDRGNLCKRPVAELAGPMVAGCF
jgi:hypothetical protein